MALKCIFPARLQKDDVARVISFGLSLRGAPAPQRDLCDAALASLGIRVSLGAHVDESDELDTSPVLSRIQDLEEALKDSAVRIIFSSLGGMNAAQILRFIDWDAMKADPRIFCGFSDMAALVNAIHAKTGIVTYYGPFYGTFGMKHGLDYTLESLRSCVFTSEPYFIQPAETWSDDAWWADQENRTFHPNPGPSVITAGETSGRLVGGHLTSLATLFGTEFAPDFTDSILFLEENSEVRPRSFDRLLQSVIHQPTFPGVKALMLGRFTSAVGMTDTLLIKILRSYREFDHIPVVTNMSFGHTYPQATLPIGGTARLTATEEAVSFEVLTH